MLIFVIKKHGHYIKHIGQNLLFYILSFGIDGNKRNVLFYKTFKKTRTNSVYCES